MEIIGSALLSVEKSVCHSSQEVRWLGRNREGYGSDWRLFLRDIRGLSQDTLWHAWLD